MQGFACYASDNTWAVVIHDAAGGNVVFHQETDVVNAHDGWFMLSQPIYTTLYVTTLTDVGMLLIYTC